jgi:hypothetical protein
MSGDGGDRPRLVSHRDALGLALRSLLRRPLRSARTLAGVTLGSGLLVAGSPPPSRTGAGRTATNCSSVAPAPSTMPR